MDSPLPVAREGGEAFAFVFAFDSISEVEPPARAAEAPDPAIALNRLASGQLEAPLPPDLFPLRRSRRRPGRRDPLRMWEAHPAPRTPAPFP